MEIHVSERRYKCGECGKLYKTIGHVREHMRAHSDERPYHCSRCSKGYKTKVSEKTAVFLIALGASPNLSFSASSERPAGAPEDPRGRETVRLSVLHQRLPRERLLGATHPPSHWRKAVQMPKVQPRLRRARDSQSAHARQGSACCLKWNRCRNKKDLK